MVSIESNTLSTMTMMKMMAKLDDPNQRRRTKLKLLNHCTNFVQNSSNINRSQSKTIHHHQDGDDDDDIVCMNNVIQMNCQQNSNDNHHYSNSHHYLSKYSSLTSQQRKFRLLDNQKLFWSSSKLSSSINFHQLLNQSSTLFCIIIFIIITFILNESIVFTLHWQENIEPKTRIHHLKDFDLFVGNDTAKDYFKFLDRDGDYLLIGARNFVYNISLPTLKENRKLEWSSNEDDIGMCKYKGKSEDACQNYIKVLAKLSDDRILVCGTNAFKPKCRSYQYGPMHNFLKLSEKPGEAICPYDPSYSSTYTFYENNLYVATVGGFTGADPLIYREPLRTDQFNPKHLNAPNFVSSFPYNGHVYFLFRETAVEYINCGKAIYSRVARVCARDNGGPHKFRARWTTFLKARLNCSIPGDFPFYFNEIQASSEIVKGLYGGQNEQLIYSVFTTPANSIGGSAICAFRMADIETVFRGPFKVQKDIDSNWLPESPQLSPRPGECSNNSQSLPENTLKFIKEHSLMDHTVQSFWNAPILVRTSFQSRFTSIAVDPQIETASGKTYDVLFIGTSNGTVLKAINAASPLAGHSNDHGSSVVPVVIEEITVFPRGTPVTQLLVHPSYYNAKLVAFSSHEIKTIRLYRCQAKTCGECVRLQDPYCSFDLQQQKCTSSRSRYWNRENFVQNIEMGWDPRCPDGRPGMPSGTSDENNMDDNRMDTSDEQESDMTTGPSAVPIYSSETFALAVVTSVVTSLVFGFIIGYIFSRRCRKDDPGICSPYDDPHSYLDPHNFAGALTAGHHGTTGLTRLTAGHGHGPAGMAPLYGTHGTLGHHYSTAGHPIGHPADMGTLVNSKPINLVLNVPKGGSKNANSSADNKPMQKVKKIYL
ncbi:semaphorin-1A isoform X2 [Dermatophagoides farinae]|uniref:semaphorin-1A isoform X2 n=1 Tax=Dermatophagoides farinae TaxID=6954 RepID=UPI003F5EF866